MKIDPLKRRHLTPWAPVFGVTLTAVEETQVAEIAATLHATPGDSLHAVQRALGYDVLRLEALEQWTTGESEALRREQIESAILTYKAVDRALTHLAVRRMQS